MKRFAADRPNPLRKGMLLAALGAAMLMVLAGGCGQFNDNPSPGGASFQMSFAPANGAAPASATSSPMLWDPALGTAQVRSVVVGAIVITHNNGFCGAGVSVCAYTDANQVTTANRDLLQQDAEQSVNFLEINPISGSDATEVEFPIPPNAAGPWQLVGIGLKNDLSAAGIAEITTVDPIFYGFVGEFLNGKVVPGALYPTPLVLRPWCSSNQGPIPTGQAGCL